VNPSRGTIRVFVSSPGDVQAERTIAERLIRTIAEELAIPVSIQYSNLLRGGEPVQPLNSSGELESGELILCLLLGVPTIFAGIRLPGPNPEYGSI